MTERLSPSQASSGRSKFWPVTDILQKGWISLLWAWSPTRGFPGTQSNNVFWLWFPPRAVNQTLDWLTQHERYRNNPDNQRPLQFLNLLAQPQRCSPRLLRALRWPPGSSPAAPVVGSLWAQWLWRVSAYFLHCRCRPGGLHRETGPGSEYSSLSPREEKEIPFGKNKQANTPPIQSLGLLDLTPPGWQTQWGRNVMTYGVAHGLQGPGVSFPPSDP